MRVPIVLRLATPRRVRSIYATFRGAEETKATYTITTVNAKGQATTQIHTAVEHVDIVQREWLLAGRERRSRSRCSAERQSPQGSRATASRPAALHR